MSIAATAPRETLVATANRTGLPPFWQNHLDIHE
jgi:hypothetical protein